MCGIVGSLNASLSQEVLDLIRHRGPDFQSLISLEKWGNKIWLGHTRLSILDVSEAGNQPMFSECGNYCIVFNGEIYNHQLLRKKLGEINFKGHSDTETILYYLKKYGIKGVKDFNGIFAFAFLDIIQGKIYLVRDHFGVKPLYYFTHLNILLFGSELKTILAHKVYKKDLDLHSLNTLLSFRYNPAPDTIFKNIYKLKAAHYLEYNLKDASFSCVQYWNEQQKINHGISKQEAIEQYRILLKQAVKRQLQSDVPVGLLLSGGLDSAVLGFLMSQLNEQPIKSFSIGFEGKGDYNELDYAKETAQLIRSEHFETTITKTEYFDFFYKSFYNVEEPIAEPTIPALNCVSKLAAQHVKVVLSGQGIDEPMAGYKRYRGEMLFSRFKGVLPFLPIKLLHKAFPRNHSLARSIHATKFKDELDRFIGIYTIYTKELKELIYNNTFRSYGKESQRHYFESSLAISDKSNGSLSRLLYTDTRTMLPDNLLLFNDKVTMANSIENRVPYLDIDLVNFIESLPVHFKLNGTTGKYLHREAVKDWIPKAIIQRKKRGFATPMDQWFQTKLSDTLSDLVTAGNSFSRNYFDIQAIRRMITLHQQKKHNYKNELFIILSLELWFKNFYTKF